MKPLRIIVLKGFSCVSKKNIGLASGDHALSVPSRIRAAKNKRLSGNDGCKSRKACKQPVGPGTFRFAEQPLQASVFHNASNPCRYPVAGPNLPRRLSAATSRADKTTLTGLIQSMFSIAFLTEPRGWEAKWLWALQCFQAFFHHFPKGAASAG